MPLCWFVNKTKFKSLSGQKWVSEWERERESVCVCVCVFFLLTFSMPHYKVILHALGLNNYSMVTYNIYNLCTVSSIVYSYSNFTSGSLM